ncbi:MAG: FAD-dependent oxidoreductase [Deltaproteobacteria bacterium]|nr:FAD-dependent oxidoreductase [Deltaproteobacteria bacterium]
MERFDVIVVGGGVNGTGTARDCAMRGLSVLLLEKQDLGCGASGGSSGMIHGGVRYMLSDRKVTELACRDSGYIQRIVPHLLFRIPFLVPFASKGERARLEERAEWYAFEVYFGAYDQYQPLKRSKPSVRLGAEELYRVEPGLRPGLHGAIAFDEWGIDANRLCLGNALSAETHGARIRTWTEAREVLRRDGRVTGVRWRDALTGEVGEAEAPVVFNASGAWSPAFGRRAGARVPMRPGKGVHLTLDRRWSDYGVLCTAVDGRQMFLMPHENESIVGTTDDDFYGDPDDIEATHDEVQYLLEGAASMVPGVARSRITRAWWGVRTTLHAYGPNEDALSRDHRLLEHAADGAAGLLSIVGGKLASYRAQAEDATDLILSLLGRAPAACHTHEEPLPGGEAPVDVAALASRHGVAEPVAGRIAYRHGARAEEVLRLCDEDPRLRLVLCKGEGILAAEVVHCLRHERVRRLQDLRRRCKLSVGSCGGLDCARPAAQLAARELSWSPEQARAELADLLEAGWRERRAVLDGHQLVQEELLRGVFGGGA